jgi:hypothetical protein
VIHQIAEDEAAGDEEIRDLIKKSFYVDDLLCGDDSINGCIRKMAYIEECME